MGLSDLRGYYHLQGTEQPEEAKSKTEEVKVELKGLRNKMEKAAAQARTRDTVRCQNKK